MMPRTGTQTSPGTSSTRVRRILAKTSGTTPRSATSSRALRCYVMRWVSDVPS